MSARFWLFSLACSGAAMAGGLSLGLFATTPPKSTLTGTARPKAPLPSDTYTQSSDLTGPAVIHCKGCGLTLADRQMAVDMAGWDGHDDPFVRDYEAHDVVRQVDDAAPVDSAPTRRSATSDEGENERSIRIARVRIVQPESTTPAEETPADAAVSY